MENKETLELAAERFLIRELNLSKIQVETLYSDYIKAVVKFHKWQQEQDNKLYSEKEVRDLFNLYKEEFSIYRNSQILNVQFEEWFNEKKKQQ
jgi:hypothetical protein